MTALFSAFRFRAAAVHLGASVVVAALASILVFRVWYPPPYADLAGGARLFLILVVVDVVIGPLLTAVAASPGKPRREWLRDLATIVVLQLAAFLYGIHTVALARPVALVFEVDLFRVVSAAEIDPAELAQAPAEWRQLPWSGPRLLGVAKPTDLAELSRTVELGLAGVPLAALPRHWCAYETQREAAWRVARPVAALLKRHPEMQAEVARIGVAAAVQPEAMRTLPVVGRHGAATALLSGPAAPIAGFLPVTDD